MMNKVLTFDCYGTLLNNDILYEYIYNLADRNGISGNKAREIFIHYEDRLMYGEDYIPYDQLLLSALEYCDMELNTNIFVPQWDRVMELHKDFRPYEDVIPVLKYLKAKHYQFILMSNSMHKIMKNHLDTLENLIDDYVLAEDTKCYKPNLKFFEYTSKKHELMEKEHYHIAKGYWWDIVPCSKLGWNKIWVNRNHITGSKKHLPFIEIQTLDELKKYL